MDENGVGGGRDDLIPVYEDRDKIRARTRQAYPEIHPGKYDWDMNE